MECSCGNSEKTAWILTLIVTGFWLIQGQLYATMPKYVIRLLGESAKPEWLANVNPASVVIFVVLFTQIIKKYKAVSSMIASMLLMPFVAIGLVSALSLFIFRYITNRIDKKAELTAS